MKKSKAKKLADSGLRFHHLNSLFDTRRRRTSYKISESTNKKHSCSWKYRPVDITCNNYSAVENCAPIVCIHT